MRPSSISAISQSAIALSRRRLVRVQLTVDVPGLGRSGQLCLVQPGRMRNELLPHQKAIYQPLPIPTHSLKDNSSNAAQQSQIDEEQLNAEARHREQLQQQLELDRSLLLGLKSNLESITTLTFQRPTTTTPPPSSDPSSLPSPPLTIQGSISVSDILAHLRDDLNAFDITTEASPESQRLSVLQISKNLALDLNRSQASSSEDGFDKLGRIKKTGQYILDAEIIPSKTRIRIPVRVRPPAAEQVASISAMASSSTSPSSFSPSSQTSPKGTRAYSTSASQPLSMEASMLNKLTEAFSPAEINIRNDSSKHAHHAAMVAQGGGNGETHFFIEIVSDSFKGMTQIKRHRAINNLLKDEFERGLHALSLRTRTFEERDRQNVS
ncbi:bola-domain-containing protein [Violaceomyces palustris]|uniref:Bola-domain-containing protein n=1 Tax=Violaceomyces palustris TaxID=1673888 RepID=A0ACD0NLM7_9BASI|nr:bola-domain-containing protein [Violaceomyces palustris]